MRSTFPTLRSLGALIALAAGASLSPVIEAAAQAKRDRKAARNLELAARGAFAALEG